MTRSGVTSTAWCHKWRVGFILFIGQLRIAAGIDRAEDMPLIFTWRAGEVSRTLYVGGVGLLLTISVAINYGCPRDARQAPQ